MTREKRFLEKEGTAFLVEEQIKKCLKKQAMTIEEVANEIDISRATASKYLLVLQLKGAVSCREIGRAKLFSLR